MLCWVATAPDPSRGAPRGFVNVVSPAAAALAPVSERVRFVFLRGGLSFAECSLKRLSPRWTEERNYSINSIGGLSFGTIEESLRTKQWEKLTDVVMRDPASKKIRKAWFCNFFIHGWGWGRHGHRTSISWWDSGWAKTCYSKRGIWKARGSCNYGAHGIEPTCQSRGHKRRKFDP